MAKPLYLKTLYVSHLTDKVELVNRFQNWEAIIKFHINGKGALGADGLAFWYTQIPQQLGNFFGGREDFTGLGAVIDTYDNDGSGHHPRLMVLINDGTKHYQHDHNTDQQKQTGGMELGGCFIPARNNPNPSFLRIIYQGGTLKVDYDMGRSPGSTWTNCVQVENVAISSGSHFSFTAATGDLADNHDIYGLLIKNLDSNAGSIDSFTNYQLPVRNFVMEYLSRIRFEVIQTKQYHTAQATERYIGDSNVENQLNDLSNKLQKIQLNVQKLAPASQVQGGVLTQLSEVKASILKLQELIDPKLQAKVSTGSFQFLSYFLYIFLFLGLLVFIYGIWALFRSKSSKKPKSTHLF
eukprot:TRINITY_DN11008_c0_g1_i2.p1 TRINITY_DN11008_c0_g1~~TRINITY_DN11008_c0_g1_i2.p1  ORF type:complete len:352 (-),score=54.69 TRINITY_DN11008_c0_g1_i2:25-1080(-)